MKPSERYDAERRQNKEIRKDSILNAAKVLFEEKGIDNTTMQDIATEAGLGVATVFRLFSKKEKIVVAVATEGLKEILSVFQKAASLDVSALDKMEVLMNNFIDQLKNQEGDYIGILEEFDTYSSRLEEPIEDIERFKEVYKEVSGTFSSIIEEGKKDGSIRKDIDIDASLITLINTFAIFAKKLAVQKSVFFIELDMEPEMQLEVLHKIIIDYLKA